MVPTDRPDGLARETTQMAAGAEVSRRESRDENPFRPGGELDRAASEIVHCIKENRPLTPSPSPQPPCVTSPAKGKPPNPSSLSKTNSPLGLTAVPGKGGAPSLPVVDVVKRGEVKGLASAKAGEVEHVLVQKKDKCKCCAIQ